MSTQAEELGAILVEYHDQYLAILVSGFKSRDEASNYLKGLEVDTPFDLKSVPAETSFVGLPPTDDYSLDDVAKIVLDALYPHTLVQVDSGWAAIVNCDCTVFMKAGTIETVIELIRMLDCQPSQLVDEFNGLFSDQGYEIVMGYANLAEEEDTEEIRALAASIATANGYVVTEPAAE